MRLFTNMSKLRLCSPNLKMESIYPPNKYTCTETLTDLKSYFDNFSNDCYGFKKETFNRNKTLKDTYTKLCGKDFRRDDFKERAEICSIDNLTVSDEYLPMDVTSYSSYTAKLQRPIPEMAKCLNTIQAKIEWDEKHKTKSRDAENITVRHDFSKNIDFVPGSEIIVNIRVCRPYVSLPNELPHSDHKNSFFKCNHEIIMLGSQNLKELRDKILCASDTTASMEVKDLFNPTEKEDKDKNTFSSSLICLDDKLYIDVAQPHPVDYSIVVKQWAKEKNLTKEFITQNMQDVKLTELNFRLGYPYLYQHRGNCEHIFIFSDVRLAKKTDSLCRADYPYHNNITRQKGRHCQICHKLMAQWLCMGSDRLLHDLTLLCNDCLVSYNYIDKEKIGDFKLYPHSNKLLLGSD